MTEITCILTTEPSENRSVTLVPKGSVSLSFDGDGPVRSSRSSSTGSSRSTMPAATALDGINPADAHRLLTQLEKIKENVRNALQTIDAQLPKKEQRYG